MDKDAALKALQHIKERAIFGHQLEYNCCQSTSTETYERMGREEDETRDLLFALEEFIESL